MEEINRTYNASDFARYHAGTMSASEMHALEKAALEDPFLADALEGYAHSESPERDINELKARLSERQQKTKVFSISSVTQSKWWSIAALFIIIFGVGYLLYRTNSAITEDSLATNERKNSPEKSKEPAPILKDSHTGNDVAFQKPGASESSPGNATAPLNKNAKRNREEIENEPLSNTEQASAAANLFSDSTTIQPSTKENGAAKEYVLKGTVTDEMGNAVAYANIRDEKQKKIIVADTSGRFTLLSPDSNAKIVASAVGYNSKDIILQKDKLPIIVMNKNDANLTEVVVKTAYSKKRDAALSAPSKNLEGRVAGVPIEDSSRQPFLVNEKFSEYLEENLIPVYDANNKPLSGEVLLSFSINKNGRPQQIKVLKSTCRGCEEQAIQLLENGPDWQEKKKLPARVRIKF